MNDNVVRHDGYVSMLNELNAYEAAGINLFLGGKYLSARDVAYAVSLREEGTYMCDFVPDHTGSLREIRFDCVNKNARPRRNQGRKRAV